MAKETLPEPTAKREMLHSEKSVDCKKYGDMFFEAQRYNDAIDFYAKGNLSEELRKVKRVAVEEGDYFLLKRLTRFLKEEITEEDWHKTSVRAEAKGIANFAEWAAEEESGKRDGAVEGEEEEGE